MHLKAERTITPIKRQILTRPITAATPIGMVGDIDQQAATMFRCWQMLVNGEHELDEVCGATGLCFEFVSALAERFF